jgi:hypothetical protein
MLFNMAALLLFLLLASAASVSGGAIGKMSAVGIGCFVNGNCASGSVPGGSDRLKDEIECLEYCQPTSTSDVFVWSPGQSLCTCFGSCEGFAPDEDCPDCIAGENLCEECFSQGNYYQLILTMQQQQQQESPFFCFY